MRQYEKIALTRSCPSSLAFLLSHIVHYAPESARPNLRNICDPGVNIFYWMDSIKYKL